MKVGGGQEFMGEAIYGKEVVNAWWGDLTRMLL